jgi:hypothetical protein
MQESFAEHVERGGRRGRHEGESEHTINIIVTTIIILIIILIITIIIIIIIVIMNITVLLRNKLKVKKFMRVSFNRTNRHATQYV